MVDVEIERKFKCDLKYTDIIESKVKVISYIKIEQVYLEDGLRLRKAEKYDANGNIKRIAYTCTRKIGSGLVRQENELMLNKAEYDLIISQYEKFTKKLYKTRYIISLKDGYRAEVDIYDRKYFDISTVEVEFNSVEEANTFVPPEWFGKELTGDERYSNKNIAK